MDQSSAPSSPILNLLDIWKSFSIGGQPVDVLRGVDLTLSPGESVSVTGPSGCGKSTLLHIVGTLERPDRGRVEIAGTDPFALDDQALARFRNQTIGFVFQDHHLLPYATVLENVLVPALAFPTDLAGARRRALELVDRVGLAHRLQHRPAELSGGERQRVAVARALLQHPRLLLCDEPTGNLDPASAERIAELLFELHDGERGMIVVTHSMQLAGRFPRQVDMQQLGTSP